MAEHDVFESRLHAALVRHVADGPIDFDALGFARMVAAKEPRRRGLSAALTWRGFAIPRVAWVLLLLAGLLAALVGGTLLVGSQPVRTLPAVVPPVVRPVVPPVGPVPTCPPGSNPDKPGPVGQARPPTFEMSMAFDRAAGKIVALGADGTWTFDVCTSTWTRMHPASMPVFSLFQMLVYDAAARRTIYLDAQGNLFRAWAYDLASDTWTMGGGAQLRDARQVRLVYDPVADRVVALQLGSPGLMWSYDVGADAWQPVAQDEHPSADAGQQLLLAYDQSVDRLVSYSLDGEVRLFDLGTGTWSAPRAESPFFPYGTPMMNPFSFGGEIAYDEAARRTVLFSNGAAIAYEAAADRWETLCAEPAACAIPPECRTSPHMVYDPVNERLVVYGGRFCSGDVYYWVFLGYGAPDEVLAFDLRTRAWTVLVERSAARPAP